MKIRTASAAGLAAMTAVLPICAGCGSQRAPAGAITSPARLPVSLTISVRPDADAAPLHWSLTCDPAGGTVSDPAAACAALARAPDPFAPVKRGIMCPMIYSGPQTAIIVGTWHSRRVNATFSRADACETARWSRIGPVFGPYANPGAVRPAPGGGPGTT